MKIIADAAYLDGEVHRGGGGKTTDTDSGDVLGDSGLLEGSGVSSTRGRIDGSSQGTSTVLVDLVEGHGDGAVIGSGRKTRGSTLASSGGDTSLRGTLGGLGAGSATSSSTTGLATSTASEGIEKATLGGSGALGSTASGGSTGTHEGSDSRGSINGTSTLSTAKSGGLAAHLLGADDGGIGLRAGEGVARVTRSSVDDRETRHGDTVGALDRGDDTVGGDGAGKSSGGEGDGVTHFDVWLELLKVVDKEGLKIAGERDRVRAD